MIGGDVDWCPVGPGSLAIGAVLRRNELVIPEKRGDPTWYDRQHFERVDKYKYNVDITVRVRDCFLMVFCRSMLFLLATSRDNSSSVIWIWSFFFTRWTSVFNFVSASTTRAFSCSISMLVCLLINFIWCECNYWCRYIWCQIILLFKF